MKQPQISKLELGTTLTTTGIARLAAVLQVEPVWLERGTGVAPSWMEFHNAAEGVATYRVAHQVSHPQPTIEATTIPWEGILNVPLPKRFQVRVPDDSMSGDQAGCMEAGDWAIFETGRPPRPGRNVLVKDKTGATFIRAYHQRAPGHWRAVPNHRGYQTLDSVEDGLEILAVQTGHLY